jgi:hypothetical protein
MLDTYYLNKLALNVTIFVVKVVKCKQSSILTSTQNNESSCQKATEAKVGSGIL